MTDIAAIIERHKDCREMGECQDCPDSTDHVCDTSVVLADIAKLAEALLECVLALEDVSGHDLPACREMLRLHGAAI